MKIIHHRKGTKPLTYKTSQANDISQLLTLGIQCWHDGNRGLDVGYAWVHLNEILLTMANLSSFKVKFLLIMTDIGKTHFLLIDSTLT